MIVIGLTGSIGMGKSVAAQHFRARGIAVCDADGVVHDLYRGVAAPLIEAAFPGTTENGAVDRARLATALVTNPAGFARLEAIVHPLVRAAQKTFLAEQAAAGAGMCVLEIPLLYETGAEKRVDVVIVMSASPEAQLKRVLARPDMTKERLDSLLTRQVPDEEKRRRADFVVDTNGTIADTERQLDAIIAKLATRVGVAYGRDWI